MSLRRGGGIHDEVAFRMAATAPRLRQYDGIGVYSDWTRQRQFDDVKHDTTHVSQSEHSDQPLHSAATAACVGIRSIIDALLNRDKEMSQSEVVALFLMPTILTE